MITDECVAAAALNRVFGFKPKVGLELINELGSARAVFNLKKDELDEIFGANARYKTSIIKTDLEKEYSELSHLKDAVFLPITDPRYPSLLKDCEDPPIGLYIKATSPIDKIFGKNDFISVVGTRNITSYGLQWGMEIILALCSEFQNKTIVSGLALGVDALAHRTALEINTPTIAVLPTGIDMVYPTAHYELSERIFRQERSALISDYPPKTYALAINFLRRNRIIAALSRATILVESKARGGGLLTAKLSHSYNRDVYALPGKADDLCSMGCNSIIRERIAEPITSIKTFLKSIGVASDKYIPREKRMLNIEEKLKNLYDADTSQLLVQMLRLIFKNRDISIAEMQQTLCKSFVDISSCARVLESEALIRIDVFQRCSVVNFL